jgi:hypothetical protein
MNIADGRTDAEREITMVQLNEYTMQNLLSLPGREPEFFRQHISINTECTVEEIKYGLCAKF